MSKSTNLPIQLESVTSRTLQEQIYLGIRRSIGEGLIDPRRRLPSTRALADSLGVSRTTVLLAIETLLAEGFLESRPRRGIYVAEQPPAIADERAVERHSPARHPLLSRRGQALAAANPADRRTVGAEPRAFRLGTPALDLFPTALWARLARECVRTTRHAALDYGPLAGYAPLREAIAEQVRTRGTRCDPQQVIIVAGAQRALDLIFHLLLDAGDTAWMEEPGYTGARAALIAAGARIIPCQVDGDGMRIDDTHTAARLAYVTPSHQFPLGVAMSLERRRQLLAWARRERAWIVEDDYDCDFRYEARPLPCLHALDPDGRVIYVGTFSKALFPAMRLGFLVVPYDLIESISRGRLASDLHAPLLEQRVLAEFMNRGHYERHLRRMQTAYAERLDALRTAIRTTGLPLELRPVHAGIHAVADLRGADAEAVWLEANARKVEVMPLGHYYAHGGEPANALVLGFGSVRPAAIRAGTRALALAIQAARGTGVA
jgi:GntR family transcriptional regulator/MocR family aminotransferase